MGALCGEFVGIYGYFAMLNMTAIAQIEQNKVNMIVIDFNGE